MIWHVLIIIMAKQWMWRSDIWAKVILLTAHFYVTRIALRRWIRILVDKSLIIAKIWLIGVDIVSYVVIGLAIHIYIIMSALW